MKLSWIGELSTQSLLALLVGSYCLYTLISRSIKSFLTSRKARQNGCQPAPWYPHRDPIFGLDLFLRNLRALKSADLVGAMYHRYQTAIRPSGVNTYVFLDLGGDPVIATQEPENMRAFLATNFKSYILSPARTNVFNTLFGQGIFSVDGEQWEHSRSMLRPNFARAQINELDKLEVHVRNLITFIAHRQAEEGVVDLQEVFPRFTMDSASEFLLGESTFTLREDGDPKAMRFADSFDDVSAHAALRIRGGRLASIFESAKIKEGIQYLKDFLDERVEATLAKRAALPQKKKEMLDAETTRKGNYILMDELAKSEVPRDRIRIEILSVMAAGRDTTASLLSIVFHVLARRPEIWAKLKEEVQSEVGMDVIPTTEHLSRLSYLRGIINECLRLYPIIPLNQRAAKEDTILPLGGGPDGKSPIFVPKGMRILYFMYGMHRRTDLFGPDALEFRPERWDEDFKPGWGFLPFGGGPRICLGQQYALTEATYTIVRLLQTFANVRAADQTVWKERMTLSMGIRDGCRVVLTPVVDG